MLQSVVSALGGDVVATICSELARDYVGMWHGAPDLLLIYPADGGGSRATLVEVKGPGDKLSEKQQAVRTRVDQPRR